MYKLVMDGEWTIDKLTELTAAAYADANGDGRVSVSDLARLQAILLGKVTGW